MTNTVFYSWQSDLPNRTNRGLIQSALEKAVADLRSDDSTAVEPVVDRDTLGEPGAPDIAATILRKIDAAVAFVCDVSIVSRSENGRPCPNPNVLVELGYALKSLRSERVVLVFNTAFGDISELPFDLRFKRVLPYHMSKTTEPNTIRGSLTSALSGALKAIFKHIEQTSKSNKNSAYLTSLNQTLIKIILFGEESRDREINPWAQELVDHFEISTAETRNLAADVVAGEIEIIDKLEALADCLDEVVNYRKALGRESWEKFNSIVDQAVGQAWEIKNQQVDSVPLNEESMQEVPELIRQQTRQIQQWVERYSRTTENTKYRIFSDFLSNVSHAGYVLLQISYYKLDGISPQLSESLRSEARPLHLIENRYEMSGRESEDEVVEEVTKRLLSIEAVLGGLK
ncbi:MAG: hypothetical protein ACOYU4_11985 [Thermodesulfobacteriota bacterium]